MHYGRAAFSINTLDTITTIDPVQQNVIGQRNGMSATDIQQINRMYGCEATPNPCDLITTTPTTKGPFQATPAEKEGVFICECYASFIFVIVWKPNRVFL